jgi:hypothetical protein
MDARTPPIRIEFATGHAMICPAARKQSNALKVVETAAARMAARHAKHMAWLLAFRSEGLN